MPILAASSGIVMPGCPCTKDRASAARVPLPLRRPARRLAGRPGFLRAGLAVAVLVLVRVAEPRGRPGPFLRRRANGALAAAGADPPRPLRALAAASRRVNSSTWGLSSLRRSVISRRFSSRKSGTISIPFTRCGCARSHIGFAGYLTLVLRWTLTVDPFQVSAQSLKCALRLPLGHSTDERAADDRAYGSQRRAEFVAVVKARAAILCREHVFASRARPRRAAALPQGKLVGTALDELPVNLEVDSTHVDLLVHRVAHAGRSLVSVHELAMNRHPLL